MIDLRNIYSLSDFQRNAREHIERLKRTGRPSVLTVNGSAEIVVQDVASYQEVLDALRAGRRAPGDVFAFEPDLEPDPVVEAYKAGVDRSLLRENLRRTVQERMKGLMALQRLASEARRAGRAAGDES